MRIPITAIRTEAEAAGEQRSCGPCTACCVLPRILADDDALPHFPDGKPGYTPCAFLSPGGLDKNGLCGCSVYSDRPPVCRRFFCLWRAGILTGDERRRPDQLGLMFTYDLFTVSESRIPSIVIEAWELWSGAVHEHPGRGILDRLREGFRVVIRYYGVPCSLTYRSAEDLIHGRELSRLAAKDPPALARWLETAVLHGGLSLSAEEVPSYKQEIAALLAGQVVQPYYRP